MRDADQWRVYLADYSADVLRTAEPAVLRDVSEKQRADRWLGFGGARPEQLAALQKRLGTALPPSYRAFLQVSDGWLNLGSFMYTMRTTGEVGWLRDVEPDMCHDEHDEETRIVARSLLISGDGDAQYWLLDPGDVNADGEWAAYVWASWYPGLGDRLESFEALVDGERDSYERLRGADGHPVHPEGAEELVAEGRALALRGEVEAAADAFERAAVKGSGAGAYLGTVLSAFLKPDLVHHEIRNQVLAHAHVVIAVGAELVRAEAVPLFLRRDRMPSHLRLLNGVLTEAEISGRFAPPVLPEAPLFQAALDRARELVHADRPDEAWQVIVQALPAWSSDSPHRIAPVILLTDPDLCHLITRERAQIVIRTPRGADQPVRR
ncbi:SMI1/KNR4 family protein [Actinoplanes sp. HUAS TT8]|uniref:SMI1/KNR4 family protein n=1 Tax=Actinoplanes sp. HUAS TT8 TaxID=3447453 RepID=UPI003F527CD8